jgi:pyrroline-5-carboxylate reductase
MAGPTRPEKHDKLADFAGQLVLVGAGRMGGAMLEAWVGLGVDPARLTVLEPNPSPELRKLVSRGLQLNPDAPRPAGVLLLAVKPQIADEVMARLAPWVGPATLVISIMAGRALDGLARAFPKRALVRAMPNLPASIRRGITVAVGGPAVREKERDIADRLLGATGSVEWVQDEGLLDAVTAVSGSGPAYVFLLAEALGQAGVSAGLPVDLAGRLARATVCGAGALLDASPLAPGTLRENVTSPGGTTAAALGVLTGENGLPALLERAVLAATQRSRELAR